LHARQRGQGAVARQGVGADWRIDTTCSRHDQRNSALHRRPSEATHPRMNSNSARVADYETNVLSWSEHQASLLRGLPRSALPKDLDLDLDLDHIIEEIEAAGASALRSIRSFLRVMLVHAIKAASLPHSGAVRHWLAELTQAQIEAAQVFEPSMRQRLDLETVWQRAVRQAAGDLAGYGETPLVLPTHCPFDLADLLDENASRESFSERLRAASRD